jgi:hypothetical protein
MVKLSAVARKLRFRSDEVTLSSAQGDEVWPIIILANGAARRHSIYEDEQNH